MVITGYFPDFNNWRYENAKIYRFHEGNPSSRELVDRSVFESAASSYVSSAAARDASTYSPTDPNGHFGPFGCTTSGSPITPPPNEYIDLYPRVRSRTGLRWMRRIKTDDIIVTNTSRGNCEINYFIGYTDANKETPIRRSKTISNTGLFPIYSKNKQWIVLNGWVWETSSMTYYATRLKRTQTAFTPISKSALADAIKSYLSSPQDGQSVTSCLANANDGTVDALTALAEMPETLRSILEAIKVGIKMYKDARLKTWRLYNKGKANTGITQSQATAARNAKELADAIANVWLNFRYNITPTKILIEDLLKTLDTKISKFLRFREFFQNEIEVSSLLENYTTFSKLTQRHRVFIKRCVSVKGNYTWNNLILTNVAVTGYELVPFSFVFDWFVNLGDYITALFVRPAFKQEGATYSWTTEGTVTVTHKIDHSGAHINVRGYVRHVINPRLASNLAYNPDINLFRQLDALALGWQLFKKEIMATISRGLVTR